MATKSPEFHHMTCKHEPDAHCASKTCTWLYCSIHRLVYSEWDPNKSFIKLEQR